MDSRSTRTELLNPFDLAILRAGAMAAAPQLLGAILSVETPQGQTAGRIVEVEAYTQDDPGSHSHRGRTNRNATMFGPAGHLYVYWCYGVHLCANVVTGEDGIGEAILLRALEPIDGIALMRQRRPGIPDHHLCRGPGNLTRSLGITRDWDNRPFSPRDLQLFAPPHPDPRPIDVSPRIGLGPRQAPDWLRRFTLRGSPALSGSRVTHLPLSATPALG